jgi:hypothetical protein
MRFFCDLIITIITTITTITTIITIMHIIITKNRVS